MKIYAQAYRNFNGAVENRHLYQYVCNNFIIKIHQYNYEYTGDNVHCC